MIKLAQLGVLVMCGLYALSAASGQCSAINQACACFNHPGVCVMQDHQYECHTNHGGLTCDG